MVATNRRTRKTREVKIADRYRVVMVPVSKISPCPENDDLYGKVCYDEQMTALITSIEKKGLEEPLILTRDYRILSGHRRFFAVKWLGWESVPCRIRRDISWSMNTSIHAELAEYNPQRIKSVGSLLKEALLRDLSPEDTYDAIQTYKESSIKVDVDFMSVAGIKEVRAVSEKKLPFLMAAKWVIDSLKEYWPLSIRQIHYNLLNNPPFISTPKRSSKDAEHYRYRNDQRSYDALVELLKMARYHGHVPMHVIDDPTRPQLVHDGFNSISEFVNQEVENFLVGYHRDRQNDQPRHIEIFCEKNTVYGMLSRVAKEYYVPIQAGRGFCSTPVWRNIAQRFRASGRKAMTLIVASDYDPEGLELADDAIRTLRDLWGIPVEGHRVAVNREQIDELKLAEDFNPAKPESAQFSKFVERTGDTKTWELESLPPNYLLAQTKAAIEANMDMGIFNAIVKNEREDADRLFEIKQTIAGQLKL